MNGPVTWAAVGSLADRVAQLSTTAGAVRETAQHCRDKIADPPRLAVPDIAALGPVPPVPDGADVPGSWTAARAALDGYQSRLQQAAAALAEAGRRYAAPLAERAELRGLAQAYRAKAAASGSLTLHIKADTINERRTAHHVIADTKRGIQR